MKKINYILIILAIICLLYLTKFISLSSYESNILGNINNDIANWNIELNGVNITTSENRNITINDVNWINENAKNTKVAPGSVGTIKLIIDPKNTEVAINYELIVDDYITDNTQILTVNEVTSPNTTITRLGNIYSGTISVSDITNELKPEIDINVEWVNDENNNERDSLVDEDTSFLKLSFKAEQNLGSGSSE